MNTINKDNIPYDYTNVPINTDVWAFAYKVDDNTNRKVLSCLPTKGRVISRGNVSNLSRFYPYSKKGQLLKTGVNSVSRYYTDTYEQAVELYNLLVMRRMNKLNRLISECQRDLIR